MMLVPPLSTVVPSLLASRLPSSPSFHSAPNSPLRFDKPSPVLKGDESGTSVVCVCACVRVHKAEDDAFSQR